MAKVYALKMHSIARSMGCFYSALWLGGHKLCAVTMSNAWRVPY